MFIGIPKQPFKVSDHILLMPSNGTIILQTLLVILVFSSTLLLHSQTVSKSCIQFVRDIRLETINVSSPSCLHLAMRYLSPSYSIYCVTSVLRPNNVSSEGGLSLGRVLQCLGRVSIWGLNVLVLVSGCTVSCTTLLGGLAMRYIVTKKAICLVVLYLGN